MKIQHALEVTSSVQGWLISLGILFLIFLLMAIKEKDKNSKHLFLAMCLMFFLVGGALYFQSEVVKEYNIDVSQFRDLTSTNHSTSLLSNG
jgi:hypothetical protein